MNWYHKFIKEASFRNPVSMLAKRISTPLFEEIKKRFENKQLRTGIIDLNQISLDQKTKEKIKEIAASYEIKNITVEIRDLEDRNHSVGVDANFIRDWRSIDVNIYISPYNFGKGGYEFLSTEIRNALQHEIEHAENTHRDRRIPDSAIGQRSTNIAICIQQVEKYLMNESEINAHVKDCIRRAKNTGKIAEDLIKKNIRDEFLKCNPLEINSLINRRAKDGIMIENMINKINIVYQNRLNQIYSNRSGYNVI